MKWKKEHKLPNTKTRLPDAAADAAQGLTSLTADGLGVPPVS